MDKETESEGRPVGTQRRQLTPVSQDSLLMLKATYLDERRVGTDNG